MKRQKIRHRTTFPQQRKRKFPRFRKKTEIAHATFKKGWRIRVCAYNHKWRGIEGIYIDDIFRWEGVVCYSDITYDPDTFGAIPVEGTIPFRDVIGWENVKWREDPFPDLMRRY